MAKSLDNYFADWTRVDCNFVAVTPKKHGEMINFCVFHFGSQGGEWDRAKERTDEGKTIHYFRFKHSNDALLFRLQFGNM